VTARRREVATRLVRGWQEGFSAPAGWTLALMEGGYRFGLAGRDWLYARGLLRSRSLTCPVVSIGNLTVGGTGKTPAVEVAAATLVALGRRPAVISRGYGRKGGGISVVADAAAIRLDAEQAGDEPFLLARRLPGVPVVVGANRYAAARLAIERFGVDAIVLDDAFQHRTLHKDLEIVMVRAHEPFGNGRLLPRGPLREPLRALARAQLIVITGAECLEGEHAARTVVAAYAPHVPVLSAAYVPAECWEAAGMRPVALEALAGQRLLAFAGIASPSAFARTLAVTGLSIVALEAFVDHHWYSQQDLVTLERRARDLGGDGLITTEKDWARLRGLSLPGRPLYVLSVRLGLRAGEAVWRARFERTCLTA